MADSNLTKRALASALKELMKEEPFAKISIGDICAKCHMNRNSFYYHFKDKYELVNWIFDTEFVALVSGEQPPRMYTEHVKQLEDTCVFFYNNRDFYRKALQIKGQNAFSDHFREFVRPIMELRISRLVGESDADDFSIDFFVDAVLCALMRWLRSTDCMPPKEFAQKLVRLVVLTSAALQKEIEQERKITERQR